MMKKDMAAASLDSQRRGCRGFATLLHPRYLLTRTRRDIVEFWTRKQERLTAEQEVKRLMEPAERAVEHKLKLIEEAHEALNRLRGLIGETCNNCHHAEYCGNRINYENNTNWILGCQNWKLDARTDKDDIIRFIGNVLDTKRPSNRKKADDEQRARDAEYEKRGFIPYRP